MAKPFGGKRPQDLRHTLRRFMDYLGRHKIMLGIVGLLAAVSALAALLGTYMIRPIVNGVLENGSAEIVMRSGQRVPVSRRHLREIKDKLLIA